MKKTIEDKQQLAAAMAELPTEYANKLSAWWCRAQKPGKVYVISYDDVEDLAKQIDAHTEKASKRSQSRQNRGTVEPKTKQKQSEAEKCLAVISELADVCNVTVKDIIKQLQAKADAARETERKKAAEAAKQAEAAVNAFRNEHAELFAQYEALQAEQQKQENRSIRLCGRSKKLTDYFRV